MDSEKKNSFTTVTPLSKVLAALLFIILPFVGLYVGYAFAPEKVVEVEKVIVKESPTQVESEEKDTVQIDNLDGSSVLQINSEDYVEVGRLNDNSSNSIDCNSSEQFTSFIKDNSRFGDIGDCSIVYLDSIDELSKGDAIVVVAYECGGCAEFYALDETNSFITQKLDNYPYFHAVIFSLPEHPSRHLGMSGKQIFEYDIRTGETETLYEHVDADESLLLCEHGCSAEIFSHKEHNNVLVIRIFNTGRIINSESDWLDAMSYRTIVLDL